jgi:acetyltransferase
MSGRERSTVSGSDAPTVRPATEADVPAILDFYRELSGHALSMRFFAPPSGDALARVARLDPPSSVVWVAVVPGADGERVVAEARCVPGAGEEDEFALVVHEEYQRRGLASLLLDRLREEARGRGVERLQALVRTDNDAMLRMLLKAGCAVVEPASDGDVTVDVSTTTGMPGWPAGHERPRVLVESRGWWPTAATAALRRAGYQVRTCLGPNLRAELECPLLAGNECPLVRDADAVVCLLPDTDAECAAIAETHLGQRPERLSRTSGVEVVAEVERILGQATSTQSPSSTC